jgi:hypothetical protein
LEQGRSSEIVEKGQTCIERNSRRQKIQLLMATLKKYSSFEELKKDISPSKDAKKDKKSLKKFIRLLRKGVKK